MWFVHYALYALIPFFAVLFGADVVKSVLDNIPEVIMNGLTVAGNLLPAVGMAMLLRMLWSKILLCGFLWGRCYGVSRVTIDCNCRSWNDYCNCYSPKRSTTKNISVHAVQSDAAVNATLDQEEEDFFQ